jgi:hypothetical protein
MGLEQRVSKLERQAEDAAVKRAVADCDLTLLTDDELISLEACFSEAKARGLSLEHLQQQLTPELKKVIDKCFSGKGAGA